MDHICPRCNALAVMHDQGEHVDEAKCLACGYTVELPSTTPEKVWVTPDWTPPEKRRGPTLGSHHKPRTLPG